MNTTAASVIYGWIIQKIRTTVPIADFVVLVALKTSNIVTIVGCVLTRPFMTTIIARVESTSQIALCVKNIYSVPAVPLMRCPVVMPFIGNVSGNVPFSTYAVIV